MSINNLKELNLEKQRIKGSLTKSLDSPMSNVFSFLGALKNNKRKKKGLIIKQSVERNELMDEGVKALLTLVASAAVSRFKLNTLSKMIITSGVALATPYVVDFIQKKINS